MALENKNSVILSFGSDMEIKGAVSVIYDPLVTGFRAATTADFASGGGGGGGGGLISGTVSLTSQQFTPTISTVTGSGSISNVHFAEFIFSTGFAGTILGSYFYGTSAASYPFPVLQNGSTYGSIYYNIPSGSAQLVSF